MWFVIVTCCTLSWTLTSLLSSMIMLSALLSPQWLLGKGENSIGVYTRCMEKPKTDSLQCTTLATRGLATDPEVFPTEWKIATIFIAIGLTIMFISVIMSFAACCFQSIFKKSLFTTTGAAQTIAGIFYILALTLHPMAWDATRVVRLCDNSSPFFPGRCAIGLGLWLALAGTGLTFLAAVLSMPADRSTNSDKVQDRIYEGHSLICLL